MTDKAKRRFGDRRDGKLVSAPGLQTVMTALMPKRTEAEVYLSDKLDATELVKWLDEQNKDRPKEERITIFHCAITGLARMVRERPLMNRFIQGYRIYERNEISLSFVAKRRFTDGSEETLMYFIPEETDTPVCPFHAQAEIHRLGLRVADCHRKACSMTAVQGGDGDGCSTETDCFYKYNGRVSAGYCHNTFVRRHGSHIF